jgi:hypothetical protein
MKSPVTKVLFICAATVIASCATIMHGTNQDVGISSMPSGAKVTIDNKPLGSTPVVAKLSRGDHHIVKIELEGHQPFEATLTRKVSGWVWGNIVFGGLIGLAVDAISGGLYSLTPDQVAGQLAKQGSDVAVTRDGIYVFLVPRAHPTWQRVATIE